MKNLFVLLTDKPSRLYVRNDVTPPFYSNFQGKPVNIYITNDEEIKEGDWYLTNKNTLCKCIRTDNKYVYSLEGGSSTNCKKIILTTDQDLIKDGIQAIPDEFLEWFVKNPSCESVEVERDSREVGGHNGGVAIEYGLYEIIIPKEESFIEYTNTNDCTSMIYNSKEEPKQICDNCKIEISKYGCACGGKPKQETLEEVGMYQQELFNYLHDLGVTALQSEMQEIERIVLGMQNINALHFEIDALKREIKVFKHQQEQDKNKFSEEDLHNAFYNGWLYRGEDYQFPKAKKEWLNNLKTNKI